MTNRRLQREVLRSVSRSFFLSLRLLPRRLRDPISLAYLLARATDTVADTADVPVGTRLQVLAELDAAIQAKASRKSAGRVRSTFAGLQQNEAERKLIESLPICFEWLDSLGEEDRGDVREALGKIVHGQTLDLQRFGEAGRVRALKSAAELDEYTYLVAGCVGEFWTRVCSRHLPEFSRIDEAGMRRLGIVYGQGLQLINILRDLGGDLRSGRCYLPEDELAAAGVAPDQLAEMPAAAAPVLKAWREKAELGMAAGLEYAAAIRNRRVRVATALPALIGIRTLARLREAGVQSIDRMVKVPRGEVRSLVVRTLLSGASSQFLRRYSE